MSGLTKRQKKIKRIKELRLARLERNKHMELIPDQNQQNPAQQIERQARQLNQRPPQQRPMQGQQPKAATLRVTIGFKNGQDKTLGMSAEQLEGLKAAVAAEEPSVSVHALGKVLVRIQDISYILPQ